MNIEERAQELTRQIEQANIDAHKKASFKSLLIAACECENTDNVYACYLINQVKEKL